MEPELAKPWQTVLQALLREHSPRCDRVPMPKQRPKRQSLPKVT